MSSAFFKSRLDYLTAVSKRSHINKRPCLLYWKPLKRKKKESMPQPLKGLGHTVEVSPRLLQKTNWWLIHNIHLFSSSDFSERRDYKWISPAVINIRKDESEWLLGAECSLPSDDWLALADAVCLLCRPLHLKKNFRLRARSCKCAQVCLCVGVQLCIRVRLLSLVCMRHVCVCVCVLISCILTMCQGCFIKLICH